MKDTENKKVKTFRNIKVETLPESRVRITGEIDEKTFDQARREYIDQAKATTEIPGFRAGKAPEHVIVKHVGEMKILERAAESCINEAYDSILTEHGVRAIGMPTLSITKLALGNPLGFSLETAVFPEISLAGYKKFAKEARGQVADAPTKIEEKEIDQVIEDIRKHFAQANIANTEKASADKTATKSAPGSGSVKDSASPAPLLPEFNDDFVKQLGDYKNVADFREKAQKNILEHKQNETREKRRAAIADKLISEAKFEVPELIIQSELDTMMNQFRADIERNGLTMEGYLNSIKRKEEEIRAEWRESAIRRARLELILKHIARAEKIAPTEEEIKKDVDHIMSHHKTADRFRARMYVENLMTNQKVLEFLEKTEG